MSDAPSLADRSRAPRRALLIVNAASRRGGEAASDLVRWLEADGLQVVVERPASRAEVSPAIERRAGAVDRVVVGGGDGTVNAAAPALLRTGLPLGVIPLGTANDLARSLGLPLDPRAACAVAARDGTRRIDLGRVNGHPFFNVASLGLSSELAERLTGARKRWFGRLGYVLTALGLLFRARRFRALILTDGQGVRVRTYQVAVGNGRYYGGGLPVRHDARIDDARLDLYSLEFKTPASLVLAALDLRRGRQGAWREVRDVSGDRFEVRTRKPRPVNLDGELLTHTPARFELLPGALEVFAPPPRRPTPPRLNPEETSCLTDSR